MLERVARMTGGTVSLFRRETILLGPRLMRTGVTYALPRQMKVRVTTSPVSVLYKTPNQYSVQRTK